MSARTMSRGRMRTGMAFQFFRPKSLEHRSPLPCMSTTMVPDSLTPANDRCKEGGGERGKGGQNADVHRFPRKKYKIMLNNFS